jgi:ADP-ribose pyrophosphatase YjhB (NUDIX family)
MERKVQKIWLVSGIAVEYQGKFLITQQSKGQWHEGKWAIPGGVIEPSLTVLENAKKEVKEEAGLDVEVTGLLGIQRRELKPKIPTDPTGILVYFLYHGKAQTNKVRIQEEEIADYKWLTLEELKNFPQSDFREIMSFVIKRIEERREFSADIIYEGEE